jgi:hypothetical protein
MAAPSTGQILDRLPDLSKMNIRNQPSALYQGTTSVVPPPPKTGPGFAALAAEGRIFIRLPTFSAASLAPARNTLRGDTLTKFAQDQ